jgi:hypothetical protein
VSVPSTHVDQATSKDLPLFIGTQSILWAGDGIFLDGKFVALLLAAAAVKDDFLHGWDVRINLGR